MITVIIIGILAVFFAYSARYQFGRYGLEISFLIITIFLAIRYDFGNDYMSYLNMFERIADNEINIFSFDSINFENETIELGWVWLNYLFKPFGFYTMIAVISAFQCWVYYDLIKKYVRIEYYWLAIFIYVFNPELMMVQASMMRQTLAIIIFYFSLRYIFKKQLVKSFVLIFCATLFHTSANMLYPFIFIGYIKDLQIGNRSKIFIMFSLICLFVFRDSLVVPFEYFIELMGYGKYLNFYVFENINFSFGPANILNIVITLCALYTMNIVKKDRILQCFPILSLFLLCFGLIFPIAIRLMYFFSSIVIITSPRTYCAIKREEYKSIFLWGVLLLTCYSFYSYMTSPIWSDKLSTYKTIFFN